MAIANKKWAWPRKLSSLSPHSSGGNYYRALRVEFVDGFYSFHPASKPLTQSHVMLLISNNIHSHVYISKLEKWSFHNQQKNVNLEILGNTVYPS